MDKTLKQFKHAILATDSAVFQVRGETLKVLLIKVNRAPYAGHWAIPGGLVRPDETLEEASERVRRTKTGLKGVYAEQLFTFGRPDRDPRGRVVSVAYLCLAPDKDFALSTTPDHGEVDWFPVNKLPKLAYDHAEIIRAALVRLQGKLEYTNIVQHLLPREFTMSDLQICYETVLGRSLDKRNFRKKLQTLDIIVETGKERSGLSSRPAQLYRFKDRKTKVVEIL